MSKIPFQTAYVQTHSKRYTETQKGRTHQSFKDECCINKLMAKYVRTGELPPQTKQALYGDFSNPQDYQTAHNTVVRAQAQFESLDAKVRDRFENNPVKFLEFTSDASNAEEMVKLGLMKKDAVERVQNAKNEKKTEPKNEAK